MTAIDPNLMLPGECETPLPVPPLWRTYRLFVPLLDLTLPGGTRMGPPHGPYSSVAFNARRAALADSAADVFGGVPLNALETAEDPRWSEPGLKAIEVADPAELVRAMAVEDDDRANALELRSDHVRELLDNGMTLAPRADGGFVRLALSPEAKKPLVHQVEDLQVFLRDPAVTLASGRRRSLRLSQTALKKLSDGTPVVIGSGTNATVLLGVIHEGLVEGHTGDEKTKSTGGGNPLRLRRAARAPSLRHPFNRNRRRLPSWRSCCRSTRRGCSRPTSAAAWCPRSR